MLFPSSKKMKIEVPAFLGGMNGSVDENVLSLAQAKEVVNFDVSGGALRAGLGLSELDFGGCQNFKQRLAEVGNILWVCQFRRMKQDGARGDFLICLSEAGDLVAVDIVSDQPNKTIWTGIEEVPVAVNYNLESEDVVIFCGKNFPMIVWNGVDDAYSVADAPQVTSMVVHYERLFATASGAEKNSVWFSDDLDPTNWTLSLLEAGFVQMVDERGASNKVLSFLDYVYVFREYGIARISGYGDQTQFLVSQLSTSSGKIFPNTVTLCGDVVLFLAEDGIYSFNGLSTTKILPAFTSFFEGVDNTDAVATAGDGKWFLSAKMWLENADGIRVLTPVVLEYDLNKKKVCVGTGLGVVCLAPLRTEQGSKVLAVAEHNGTKTVYEIDHSGAVLGESLSGVWKSTWSDLSCPQMQKMVRRIALYTKNWATVTIETDSQKQVVDFYGDRHPDYRMVAVRGTRMRFVIEANAKDAEISGFVAELFLR